MQDWIDVTERRRSYLFTWHNFVAIEAGIASPQQARVPIRRLLVSLPISGGASSCGAKRSAPAARRKAHAAVRRRTLHARPIAVQAAQIMRAVDAQRSATAAKFNLSLAQLWCTPSNFVPLAPDDNLYCQVGAGRRVEARKELGRGREGGWGQALAG